VPPGGAIRRDGAGEGDVICVSGELGRSEAGRILLAKETDETLPGAMRGEATTAHLVPRPRFDVARLLMGLTRRTVDVELEREEISPVRPTAMIDVSDGLGVDLHRLCEASHVGCRVEERDVPVSAAARRIAEGRSERPLDLALRGGEDFELLFTLRAEDVEVLLAAAHKAALSISLIGKILPFREGRQLVGMDGRHEDWPHAGFDHFRRGR
jgi:thiamine-monophosphate kinase